MKTSTQVLEIRSDGMAVSVRGTVLGLTWLAQKCFVLVDGQRREHIHLDDYYVLTADSRAASLEYLPKCSSAWQSFINRTTKFVQPNFSDRCIEFRDEHNCVYIYGTSEGLAWLARKCLALVDAGRDASLHLTDYRMLTQESKPADLALVSELVK